MILYAFFLKEGIFDCQGKGLKTFKMEKKKVLLNLSLWKQNKIESFASHVISLPKSVSSFKREQNIYFTLVFHTNPSPLFPSDLTWVTIFFWRYKDSQTD